MTIEKLTKKSNITTCVLENNLPPKYPHLTSHYQPLTTKPFIEIDWFTTNVSKPTRSRLARVIAILLAQRFQDCLSNIASIDITYENACHINAGIRRNV